MNLRPDSPDNVIDNYLAFTDIGKILLEADVQLKKDTASYTSPSTPEGRKYWNKLYEKAGQLFGYDNTTIPTLTRPWIVPGEIIIRESKDNAYIYKATLKVMLEQDYIKGSSTYNFTDPRMKALNEYSSQLIRELIIPKITKEVNTSRKYAPLRQVYYSIILAQWFKSRFKQGSPVTTLVDSRNLTNLASKELWSKTTYFDQYQSSFKNGEYNIKEPVQTPYGQTVRSYFSGGIALAGEGIPPAGQTRGAVSVIAATRAWANNTKSYLAEFSARSLDEVKRLWAEEDGDLRVPGAREDTYGLGYTHTTDPGRHGKDFRYLTHGITNMRDKLDDWLAKVEEIRNNPQAWFGRLRSCSLVDRVHPYLFSMGGFLISIDSDDDVVAAHDHDMDIEPDMYDLGDAISREDFIERDKGSLARVGAPMWYEGVRSADDILSQTSSSFNEVVLRGRAMHISGIFIKPDLMAKTKGGLQIIRELIDYAAENNLPIIIFDYRGPEDANQRKAVEDIESAIQESALRHSVSLTYFIEPVFLAFPEYSGQTYEDLLVRKTTGRPVPSISPDQSSIPAARQAQPPAAAAQVQQALDDAPVIAASYLERLSSLISSGIEQQFLKGVLDYLNGFGLNEKLQGLSDINGLIARLKRQDGNREWDQDLLTFVEAFLNPAGAQDYHRIISTVEINLNDQNERGLIPNISDEAIDYLKKEYGLKTIKLCLTHAFYILPIAQIGSGQFVIREVPSAIKSDVLDKRAREISSKAAVSDNGSIQLFPEFRYRKLKEGVLFLISHINNGRKAGNAVCNSIISLGLPSWMPRLDVLPVNFITDETTGISYYLDSDIVVNMATRGLARQDLDIPQPAPVVTPQAQLQTSPGLNRGSPYQVTVFDILSQEEPDPNPVSAAKKAENDSDEGIARRAKNLGLAYQKLPELSRRIIEAYIAISKKYNDVEMPGQIKLYLVGGRVKMSPFAADSDLDLIIAVDNPEKSFSLYNYTYDPNRSTEQMGALLERHQVVSTEIEEEIIKICAELGVPYEDQAGRIFHVVRLGGIFEDQRAPSGQRINFELASAVAIQPQTPAAEAAAKTQQTGAGQLQPKPQQVLADSPYHTSVSFLNTLHEFVGKNDNHKFLDGILAYLAN
ncbi:MAG: hypothetical protein WCY12_06640, partial [Candidatus Omnitrophota bacterium]